MTGGDAVLLPVRDDLYALPVGWVREVVAAPTLTRLATAPSVVLGLFNLRGQIVALLDTGALLCLGPIGASAFAVVVNCPQGPVGLAASSLPRRVVLDESIGASELPSTSGLYRVDNRVAVLLDPATLLTPERLGDPAGRLEPAPAGVS